jgi:hypothetical protein
MPRFILAEGGEDEPIVIEATIDDQGNAALLLNGWYTVGINTSGEAILYTGIPDDIGLQVDDNGQLWVADEVH